MRTCSTILSLQCADVAQSAKLYDAVLAPLGGGRIMDFGDVIGFGIAPTPNFWMSPQEIWCGIS